MHALATAGSEVEPDQAYPNLIVGVGASAGGLEALERLFERMPTDTGMAFVVVQHLSPDFKSLTDDILARKTRLPIRVVEDGMVVRADTIHLIPPRKDMIIRGGCLQLTDKDPALLLALPIDHFFRSLAQEAGDRSVAIILSGTGSDGSRGVRDVHSAGGLVVVQDPDSAKFDGMPRSALDSGVVDLSLPPEAIPEALVRHAHAPHTPPEPPAPAAPGVDTILRLLRDTYGIDFSQYKPDTVLRRLERRLTLNETSGLEEYSRQVANDPAELNLLYKDLLIGVTRFFRDPEAFARLARDVIPTVLNRLPAGEELRVWVAGCATGEEAYSLAILLRECMAQTGRDNPVKIFATDVHRTSLDFAGQGVYPESAVADIGASRVESFFTRHANGYQVSSEIRKMVVFAQHNVLKDAPFTKLDLVTCRNLLIYFRPPAQKRVLTLFHFALKTGGILFLGPSETLGEVHDEFEPLDHRWKVYRKRRDVRLVPDLRPLTASPRPPLIQAATSPDPQLAGVYDAMLDEFMPPGLLVNDRGQLLQTFGGASRYVKFREGRVTTDVLELVDAELRTALTGAIPRAFKEHVQVAYKGLRVSTGDGGRVVNLVVRPIHSRRDGVSHVLVQIEEAGELAPAPAEVREIDLGQASRDQVLTLEGELRFTKENLQAMIEEMETSNEELQATNEELVAANEELQSTNEELHSVNEELYTVNGEFQKKIVELTEMTTDMDNLLASTQVHTIFLDRALCIRKFTPKIGETFHLLPQDLGRRIDHFTYSIDYPLLLDDLKEVLDQGVPIERQVKDRRGTWFLLRVLPYRAGAGVEGVVLTLIDLTRVKQAEAETWRLGEQLAALLRNSTSWVFVRDIAGRYVLADESFKRAIGKDPTGKTAWELFEDSIAARLTDGDDRVLEAGEVIEGEVVIPLADGPHTFLSVKFPLRDETGQITGVGGIKTDVTAIRRAEQAAREAVVQRDRFLAILSHELRNPLAAIVSATEMAVRSGTGSAATSDWLGVIGRRAEHMARLVDDLLDVARLTHNKVEVRKVPIDLSDTVSGVLEEVRRWFDDAKVTLIREGPTEPLPIEGDADRLEQVQVNLLRNAAKFTPAGGTVWYTLLREASDAVIRVRDTGVGMSRETIGKMFEPFVQADETLDRAGSGIGVGLTLVRSIVGLHGGTVEAASPGPGLGSEFVVRLPLVPVSLAYDTPPAGPIPPMPAPKPLRLLVVEDDPDIRESMVSLLEIEGHSVRAVGDGRDALERVQTESFDACLLDIGLPGMTGYELVQRIRDGRHAPPFTIALTGYGRPEDREAAARAGFDAHLTKPFKPGELNRLLATIDRSGLNSARGQND